MNKPDIIIKINVTKMEKYLNQFWKTHSIGYCPTEEHNKFNTIKEVFKILKDFKEGDQ